MARLEVAMTLSIALMQTARLSRSMTECLPFRRFALVPIIRPKFQNEYFFTRCGTHHATACTNENLEKPAKCICSEAVSRNRVCDP